jgi:hypothetical protein
MNAGSIKRGEFITRVTINFSRWTFFYGVRYKVECVNVICSLKAERKIFRIHLHFYEFSMASNTELIKLKCHFSRNLF